MMYTKNLVSVIMPVYNTPERYLKIAIDSILNQTYPDVELLIIDDGSDETTKQIFDKYENIPSVRIIHNEFNSGIAQALNRGIDEAKGEFIARMDSDDIAISRRLQKQVDQLKNNPSMILSCSTACQVDEVGICDGVIIGQLGKWNRGILQCELLFNNISIVHPTVMFRSCMVKDNNIHYREEMNNVEDYTMWTECVRLGEIGWIEEPLLKYRIHHGQITQTRANQQALDADRVRQQQLEQFDVSFDEKELSAFLNVWKYPRDIDIPCLNRMFVKLIKGCSVIYEKSCLEKVCGMYWLTICVGKKMISFPQILKCGMFYYSLKPSVLLFVIKRKVIQKRRFQKENEKYGKVGISAS